MAAAGQSDVGAGPVMSEQDVLEALQDTKPEVSHPSSSSGASTWADLSLKEGRESWKDLYRVLMTSLHSSSKHFEALSLETLALGWMGLSQAHAGLRDDIQGQLAGPAQQGQVDDWLYCAKWAGAFEAGSTAEALALHLDIPVAHIASYQPESLVLPMVLPATYLAVDVNKNSIVLVVRGTTSWKDAFTDIVAHTVPLGAGHAHSGMLACAQSLVNLQLPAIKALLLEYPGYRIHCIGHSLGGGVAALVALLLHTRPAYSQLLSAAHGVVASGFGTPPVLTREMAEGCRGYVRTLVHEYDVVPRACVSSLAALRGELEGHKEQVFSNNQLAAYLRDSGALSRGKALMGNFFKLAASAQASRVAAAAVSRNPALQGFVAAGFSVGASLLSNKLKELHTEAMQPQPPGGTTATAVSGTSATAATATPPQAATASKSGASSSSVPGIGGKQAAVAGAAVGGGGVSDGSSGTGTGGSSSRAAGAATANKLAALGGSIGTWWNSRQQQQQPAEAVAVGSSKAAVAVAGGAGGAVAGAAAAATTAGEGGGGGGNSEEEQQQLLCVRDAEARAAALSSVDGVAKYDEEEAAALVTLYCPGQLYYLRRSQGIGGPTSSYELLRGEEGQAFGRIVANLSMLRDHYLSSYVKALNQLSKQWSEETRTPAE